MLDENSSVAHRDVLADGDEVRCDGMPLVVAHQHPVAALRDLVAIGGARRCHRGERTFAPDDLEEPRLAGFGEAKHGEAAVLVADDDVVVAEKGHAVRGCQAGRGQNEMIVAEGSTRALRSMRMAKMNTFSAT